MSAPFAPTKIDTFYVCIPNTPDITPAKDTLYTTALSDPNVAGFNVCSPLAEDGSQLIHIAGLSAKPFCLDCSALGLPDVPTFEINGHTIPKAWDPAFMPAWAAAMTAKIALLRTTGLLVSLTAITLLTIQPYEDGEMGVACENSVRGAGDAPTGRNDAVLAAAGWTPSGYKAAVLACVAWLNAQPELADIPLKVAFFTPDNLPRVNDAGQVVAKVDSQAFYNDLLASIRSTYTTGPVWLADTTFVGTLSPFVAQAHAAAQKTAANDNLVIQLHNTGMDQKAFTAALKAAQAIPGVVRIEIHPGDQQYLAAALAA